ncbi:MAG: hypothetical protein GF317_12600 [Candidatus Lokiarchaeota archaeon]|nr:hypothetical protein [Candidatus Lokiarchaeota archaeon]MBD3200487.1 hypothetical protein [Candidatus Lokiarchaeota archaeon]
MRENSSLQVGDESHEQFINSAHPLIFGYINPVISWEFPKVEKIIPESGMNDEQSHNILVHWLMSSMEWGTRECPEQPNEVCVAKT